MKKERLLLLAALVLCSSLGMVFADGDITAPGNPVIGLPNVTGGWPAAEAPQYGIDNSVDTKYLHFNAGPWGIIISPTPKDTVVQGVTFTSANDAQERDPISYELFGSNDESASETGNWTLIHAGDIPDFIAGVGRKVKTTTPMIFNNTKAYDHYKLMFPKNRGANLMQIAEIELLEKPAAGWPPAGLIQTPDSILRTPDVTLALTAIIDDIDSTSWTIQWSQVSGPATVDFAGQANQLEPTIDMPSVPGTYVLQLDVTDDTGNVGPADQITIRVWDAATEAAMIAYWPLNEGFDVKTVNDVTEDNDSGELGNYMDLHTDPNWVPGWIPGDGENNWALNFTDMSFITITPNPEAGDPNLTNLDACISVSAWVNATDWDGNRRIMQYGNSAVSDDENIFRFLCEGGNFVFSIGPGRNNQITTPIFDPNEWHHAVGTYDGQTLKVYFDGIEVASKTNTRYIPIFNYLSQVLYIGAKDSTISETYIGDYMKGMMDDIRIYTYPLSLEEVQALTLMGQNSAPVIVSITAPEELVLAGTQDVLLEAEVFDAHGDELTYQWEQVSPDPLDGPVAAFSSTSVEDPTVTIADAASYTFRLTVSDGEFDTTMDVTILVSNADCTRVKEDGLLMAGDLNEDCKVDLLDFAMMAANWIKCNDPQKAECENPYLVD